MRWSAGAHTLFAELMAKGPPDSLREAATRGVRRESERLCRRRGSTWVRRDDVAQACLAVSPPIFRPNVAADLAARGFDVDRLSTAIASETTDCRSSQGGAR